MPNIPPIHGNTGLLSFQAGGTTLERFLPKNQHILRKLLNFENSLKNINLEAHFLVLTFFDETNFQITLFPKTMPNF